MRKLATLLVFLVAVNGCKTDEARRAEEARRRELQDHLKKAQVLAAADDPAGWPKAEQEAVAAKGDGADEKLIADADEVLARVAAKKKKAAGESVGKPKKVCPPGQPLCD